MIYDIQKHTNGQEVPYLLGSRKKKDGTIVLDGGSSSDKLEDLKCGHMYGDKSEPTLPFFLVMNIEAIRMKSNRKYPIRERLTTLINKKYIGMVVLDECHKNCLVYDTKILTDKGLLKLGDIVTKDINVKAYSYNEFTHTFEFKSILNKFENDIDVPLMELKIATSKGIKILKCTENHKFYTLNRGWVSAKDLLATDILAEEG